MTSLAHHWYQEGEQKGKFEGRLEGKAEVARKMLEKGADIAFIQGVTGLSKSVILSLKK